MSGGTLARHRPFGDAERNVLSPEWQTRSGTFGTHTWTDTDKTGSQATSTRSLVADTRLGSPYGAKEENLKESYRCGGVIVLPPLHGKVKVESVRSRTP